MSLTVIAAVNAIVWSGIIIFLLFRMMGQRKEIESQLDRLESKIDDQPDNTP
jgi:hypothetical protein